MSVQRFDSYGYMPSPEGKNMRYDDHARIVAEATAEARAAERRHWEARFRNAEQAHATALAEATRESAAHHYRMGKARGADLALNYDVGDEVMSDISAPKMSANDAIGDILRFNIDSDAAAPRTLTTDCLHLAEMYVGQSSRDNEYGRRSSVIECLACGALRLDDETVPPNRLAGGDFDTSGQPRTLTADDRPDYKWDQEEVDDLRRQGYERGLADARAAVDAVGRWRSFPDDTLLSRAAVLAAIDALIHDGEATPQVKPCSTCGEPVAYLTARPGWAGGWLHHPARPLDGHPAAIDGEV